MATGLEIRAQIDTESVKGLLIVNGGGALALLALLPAILGKLELAPLTRAALYGLLMFQGGMVAALVHNRLRRVCNLAYERAGADSPPDHPMPCRLFGKSLGEPCVCLVSIVLMWASLVFFIVASITIFLGGMETLDVLTGNVPDK